MGVKVESVFFKTHNNLFIIPLFLTPLMETELFTNLHNIIYKNYQVTPATFVLLVYDEQCPLARLLADTYVEVIRPFPHQALNFHHHTEEQILVEFQQLPPHSLVILVQSASFRMTKHRLRADLFQQGHQVIEHARLSFTAEDQMENYVSSLHYDTPYYVQMSRKISQLLQEKTMITYESGSTSGDESQKRLRLVIDSEFEKALPNTGDFSHQASGSSGFPIGEVFTEAKQLDAINGSIMVFGFPVNHRVVWAEPFSITIKDGCLVAHQGPASFEEILKVIRQDEGGKVQVREIGFGLNRGMGFHHHLNEPTAFERFAGVHFSLGLKHAMYRRKISKQVYQKYHMDIFCLVDGITMGNTIIFKDGKYVE